MRRPALSVYLYVFLQKLNLPQNESSHLNLKGDRNPQRVALLAIEIAVDTSDQLMPQLHEGVLEVVIGQDAQESSEYLFRAVDDEALAIVCGCDHPLAQVRDIDFGMLTEFQWILQPIGSPARDVVEREFGDHHRPIPRGLIETGSILTTMSLVARSQMLGAIPATVAQRNAEHGLVATLDYRFHHKLPSYGAIVRRDRPLSAPAQHFLELFHGASGLA